MMRERILSIKRSGRKGKKYVAIVQDRKSRRRYTPKTSESPFSLVTMFLTPSVSILRRMLL